MATDWKDEFYVRCYELAKQGYPDSKIAHVLGVHGKRFNTWLKRKPALGEAIKRGRGDKLVGEGESFQEYVFGRLPKSLQELWEKLMVLQEREDGDFLSEDVEMLFEGRGQMARQQLFLFALVKNNFSRTAARRAVNIGPGTLRTWEKDPGFGELMQAVHECKKDFFESALVSLVAQGEPSAVIFANKTINKDRGYVERQEHAVAGQITHRHEIDELPLELRRQVLEALELKQDPTKFLEMKQEQPVEVSDR